MASRDQGVIAGWGKKPSADQAKPTPHVQQGQPAPASTVMATRAPAPRAPPAVTQDRIEKARVVISMTTVPARNGTLGPTLASLRAQTKQPHDIRLYLGPGCDPVNVAGVTNILVPRDVGPVTKLSAVVDPVVPATAIVITVDDDITFAPTWLETLAAYALLHADEVVGMAGWHAATLIQTGTFQRASGPCDVIEGFAGVAYRKHFFSANILEPPARLKWIDDVWISSYLHRRGITRRVVPGAEQMIDVARSQPSGLHTRPDFYEANRRAAETEFRPW